MGPPHLGTVVTPGGMEPRGTWSVGHSFACHHPDKLVFGQRKSLGTFGILHCSDDYDCGVKGSNRSSSQRIKKCIRKLEFCDKRYWLMIHFLSKDGSLNQF